MVGHLELDVVTASRRDIHELTPFPFGGGDPDNPPNFARFAPVHGWLVQTIAGGGMLNDGNSPPMANPVMADNAAWARSLNQGTLALAPLGGDRPSLDAGPVGTTSSTTSIPTTSSSTTSSTSSVPTTTTTSVPPTTTTVPVFTCNSSTAPFFGGTCPPPFTCGLSFANCDCVLF